MSWREVLGHDEILEQFRRSLSRGRLASTFLFVGPHGIGKRTFALRLAQAILCQTNPDSQLDACRQCSSCQQVAAGTHPDLELIGKPAGKSDIPVELLIGSTEKRMQEGLCHRISLKPFMGGRRVAIIDDADDLNEAGANCLLKTLEEPPPRSVMILIGTRSEKQLPTIRSRCQIIRFQPLAEDLLTQLIQQQGIVDDPQQARRLAGFSEGSLAKAQELADPQLWEFRRKLLGEFSKPHWDSVAFGRETLAFIDEAGKEAAPRRARMRQLVGFAVEYHRQLTRALCGLTPHGDQELCSAVGTSVPSWPHDAATAGECLSRCLEALEQIDRNANQAIVIECWLNDLARIARGLS